MGYFLFPDDAVDQKRWILDSTFSKQQFKASLEQFYIFNFAAEGQHEQITVRGVQGKTNGAQESCFYSLLPHLCFHTGCHIRIVVKDG